MDTPYEYEFLRPENFSLFDESDGLDEAFNLMDFTFDEEGSYGMLEMVVADARKTLDGVSGRAARAMLWLGDSLVSQVLDDIRIVDSKGNVREKDQVDFKGTNQFYFLHFVLLALAKCKIVIGDETRNSADVEVTPARFCAAYALRMAFNASRDYLSHGDTSDLRDYYLMQAAATYGLMRALQNPTDSRISDAVAMSIKSRSARDLAFSRWAREPVSEMRREIFNEWGRWQKNRSLYRYPRDFRREMQLKFPDLVDGTLKNWMSAWGRGES